MAFLCPILELGCRGRARAGRVSDGAGGGAAEVGCDQLLTSFRLIVLAMVERLGRR